MEDKRASSALTWPGSKRWTRPRPRCGHWPCSPSGPGVHDVGPNGATRRTLIFMIIYGGILGIFVDFWEPYF
jgi:hypothetical protein